MLGDLHNDNRHEPDLFGSAEHGEAESAPHPVGIISGADLEKKTVQKTLASTFERWGAFEYLKYYPEMDKEIGVRIIEQMNKIINRDKIEIGMRTIDKNTIRVSDIVDHLRGEGDLLPERLYESLENYCIFHFFLTKVVSTLLEHRPDDHLRLVDIGGGPTIYQYICLLGVVKSIGHTDYVQENCNEIESLKAGTSPFSWQSFFATAKAYREKHPEMYLSADRKVQINNAEITQAHTESQEAMLLECITQLGRCDAFQPDLQIFELGEPDIVEVSRNGSGELYTNGFGLADVITSNFCIESATDNLNKWKEGIANVVSTVPHGGFLIMTAIRNAEWYQVGNERMPATPVDADMLAYELESVNNLKILSLTELTGSNKDDVGYDGMVFVIAKRE